MSDGFTPTPVPDWLGKVAPEPPPPQPPPPAPQPVPDISNAWLTAATAEAEPQPTLAPEVVGENFAETVRGVEQAEIEHIEREAEAADEEREVADMIADGLIAFKRFWQWPANTADEADAARVLARMAIDWVAEYRRD